MRIFVDGNLEKEAARDEEPDQPGSPLCIGGQFQNGSHPFSGILDEVGLFEVALTEEDVLFIKDNGLEETVGSAAVSPLSKTAVTWAKIKRAD